ncbi:unnamed protein product [Peronospora belbahrii]|uniref:PH domain-containing protein n=1 Tax=Peronospora belbahrii TaxID=622444 RepID=A0AAU9KV86_9STRA|nr:unnamed protein product [Peronospora belbahrii]CAH0518976.1 unnamed protein product [Peronospora belbahrii]
MEGYMIRVPTEACFPDPCPTSKQQSNANQPICSRALYYVIEAGYLRGYEAPNDVNEPVESFRLTSYRLEVNTMYSLNIFEIKARIVKMRLPQEFVEDTLSSDNINDGNEQADSVALYTPQTPNATSPNVTNNSYHVVFFAANTDLVKKWSVELLNWNRFVFGPSADHDETELKAAKLEIVHALDVVNAANRFLRPVKILTPHQIETRTTDSPASTLEKDRVNAASLNVPTLALDSSNLALTERADPTPIDDLAEVVKLSDLSTQPPNPWWIASFWRHRKISSCSLGR